MRINLNGSTSVTMGWHMDKPDPPWFVHLTGRFCADYDMDFESQDVRVFLSSQQGIRILAHWLQEDGFRARYWEFDWRRNPDAHATIAYGIEFDDDCPKFVEVKLAHSS